MTEKLTIQKVVRDYGGLFSRYLDKGYVNFNWSYFLERRNDFENFNDYWEDTLYQLMAWDKEYENGPPELRKIVMGMFKRVLENDVNRDRKEIHFKNWFTYRAMGEFVAKYEGVSPIDYLTKANSELLTLYKIELNQKTNPEEWGIEITCQDEYCDFGRSQKGKRFTIEELIESRPIPNNCTKKPFGDLGCNCSYVLKWYKPEDFIDYEDPFGGL
ncbi:hypothetical protein [Robiginitalea sediminis]|uniref:hypothetical protein n=1 Tax=Robiginitalea sediminis TaxID=1982593 RepID=UPI000B4B965C|nr:hypothetical protein [Robiginitalea sediminis]